MARTGRPTRQIDPTRPFAKFATDLVAVRIRAGLTVKRLAELARSSPAVISAAADGLSLPTVEALEGYIRGCGGTDDDLAHWRDYRAAELRRVAEQVHDDATPATPQLKVVDLGRRRREKAPPPDPRSSGDGHLRDRRFTPDDPTTITTRQEFATALNALRGDRSYVDLQKAAARQEDLVGIPNLNRYIGYGHSLLPSSSLSDMLNGKTLPRPELLELYLRACEVDRQRLRAWMEARERVATEHLPRPPHATRVADVLVRDLGMPERPLNELFAADTTVPVLPPYVPRDIDEPLRRWLTAATGGRGGLLLLVGPSGAGKTRTAYEMVLAVVPSWWLYRPADLDELRGFAAAPTPRTVVWLDDLTHFDGLDPATTRRLLHGGCLIITTLPAQIYQRWTPLPQPGQPDPSARQRAVIGLATVFTIPAELSIGERARAETLAVHDERIAVAVRSTDTEPFQTVAGGSELVRRWTSAPSAQKALLTAALDARRMGVTGPLTADLLREAAVGYLSAAERATLEDGWPSTALAYATATVRGSVSALAPVGNIAGVVIGYHVNDFLAHYAKLVRGAFAPPAEAWAAYAAHLLDADDMFRAAQAAQDRALFPHAEALLRAAVLGGCGEARAALVRLLQVQDRGAEAERVRWRGLNADGTTAA